MLHRALCEGSHSSTWMIFTAVGREVADVGTDYPEVAEGLEAWLRASPEFEQLDAIAASDVASLLSKRRQDAFTNRAENITPHSSHRVGLFFTRVRRHGKALQQR